jgi:hypothetical protein
MGDSRGAYRVLVGKPEGKRPFGRPRCRWEDKISMDLQEVGWEAWSGLMWLRIWTGGRLLYNEPSVSIKCKKFLSQLRTG